MGPRIRRPLHNRHSGPRAGIQGWEFRIEPHVYSAQYGLSQAVMQRSPSARTTKKGVLRLGVEDVLGEDSAA